MMLVDYSSSSDEDSDCGKQSPDKDGGCTARKRLRTQQERLPLPGSLLTMFPDEADPQSEDRSLHGGRIRSFQHERGNWATYVYLPYRPEEEFLELLEELLSAAGAHGVALTPQEEFHLSLSQTVLLRHHWIQPFTQSLRKDLAQCNRFVCSASKVKVYSNAERTRTFVGLEVCSGRAPLLDLVRVVDTTMTEFRLDTFYKEPSFHVSLAWCVGNLTEQLKDCVPELQRVVDDREEQPFVLRLEGVELRCKTGNKTFCFPLHT